MRLSDLEAKDVVDVRSGKKLGFVSDLELDDKDLCILCLLVCEVSWKDFILIFSKPKLKKIKLDQIVCIGKDVILVKG